MEVVEVVKQEPEIVLKLTQTELNTIVAYFAKAPIQSVIEYAECENFTILKGDSATNLFTELRRFQKEVNN